MVNLNRSWIQFIGMTVTFKLLFFCTNALYASQQEEEKATSGDVKKETVEAYVALNEYSIDQRDEAITAAQDQLKKLDAKIDGLQQDINKGWNQMSAATQKKMHATLKDLRERCNTVGEWYGGLRHSSADAWEEVKKGFNDSYDVLQNAFSKASKEFESNKEIK